MSLLTVLWVDLQCVIVMLAYILINFDLEAVDGAVTKVLNVSSLGTRHEASPKKVLK